MVVVLFMVIMEDFDDFFGSSFKGQGFYLVFYFGGKAFYHIEQNGELNITNWLILLNWKMFLHMT